MTSRMEFRNYRSSAQLVHCNIHEKRYSDVPDESGAFCATVSRKVKADFCSGLKKGLFHLLTEIRGKLQSTVISTKMLKSHAISVTIED